jgi:hypothetical protein
MGKMKKGLAIAAIGLASLISTKQADAQVILGMEVTDSQGIIVTENSLDAGKTYFANLSIKNAESPDSIDFSSIYTTLDIEMYGSQPATFEVNNLSSPFNDVFQGASMHSNLFNYDNGKFTVDRSSLTGSRTLNLEDTLPFASFSFTTGSNSAGNSINFRYLTDSGETDILGGPSYGEFPLDIQFMPEYNNNYSFSIQTGAVPEPSTYAAIAGAAALAAAAGLRSRKRKSESPAVK